jgi:signal transduction histidine kinase
MAAKRQPETGVRYVDPFRDARALQPITADERTLLRQVNQKIAARPSLRAIVDYLFESTQELIPCDRIGLAFVDPDGQRVTSYYNRASYEPLAIDKEYSEDLRGSSLRAVLETGLPRIIADLEKYLEQHPRSRSTRLLVTEGVRSNLTCPLTVEGRVVGFIFRSSRAKDTYHSKHIELQMAIAERLSQAVEKAWRIEQLEQANHAYTQMLGFVSHELKSPVASMVTDARLMADGYLGDMPPKQKDKLEGLIRKGEYLLGLVREYLDLARVEGGELEAQLRPSVHVRSEIVDDAVEVVRSHLEARGMRLVVVTPGEPDPAVCCDPALMRIVLVNLLDNAVKYGREGGEVRVTLEVATSRHVKPEALRISVWNEGPGFSPNQRNQLFRRFSRLDVPETKGTKGTGVGLYNTWRIVQLHRGRVTAESKKGEWARFSVEIPAASDCETARDRENGAIA